MAGPPKPRFHEMEQPVIRLLMLHTARRLGLPLVLSEDGEGNPKWHWLP